MLDQRLAIDAHALLARAPDRLVRLNAGGVDDVDRNARLIGQHDRAVGRLALDFRRSRKRVALGTGYAFGHEVLLQRQHDVAVFGVHERHRAEFGATRERGEHLLVVDHQRALVGHEMLECGDAVRDHLRHVVADLVRPIGDAHVVGVIGGREFRALVPVGDRLHQWLASAGDDEIDQHRRAAGERGARAAVVIVGRIRAHERHVEMRVRIDPARHDVAARAVERLVALQARSDLLDRLALDEHVGDVAAIRGDDGSAFDHGGHDCVSPLRIHYLPVIASKAKQSRLSQGNRASLKHRRRSRSAATAKRAIGFFSLPRRCLHTLHKCHVRSLSLDCFALLAMTASCCSTPANAAHPTISAFSSTACISTFAPAVDHSILMSSLSLWLTPSTQGVKIIDVGATRAR